MQPTRVAASGFTQASVQRLYEAMSPAPAERAFLQACLQEGDEALRAWQYWLALTGDPLAELRRDRVGIKRHLPRLYANLSRAGCTVAREHEPYLRAAVAREQMRSRRFRAALAQALDALEAAGIDATLLKGAAIGEALLEAPWWRHSHDVDMHVDAAQLERAARALEAAGFRAITATAMHRRLDHPNGLPICLHAQLLAANPIALPESSMLARRIERSAVERTVRLLRSEDLLAHVCCHAAVHGSRLSLGWVVDAVTLLRTEGFEAHRLVDLLNTPAGWLLAPALQVVEGVVPGSVPSACLRVLPQAAGVDHRALRDLLLRAAAVSLGARRLLAGSRGLRDRWEVAILLSQRLPRGLQRAGRAVWRHPRFTHLRRHRLLRPLRRGYLMLKSLAVRSGSAAGSQSTDRSWRERGLS